MPSVRRQDLIQSRQLDYGCFGKTGRSSLANQDAYLKSAGGVKLDEPAIDLAVAVAICFELQGQANQSSGMFCRRTRFDRRNSARESYRAA